MKRILLLVCLIVSLTELDLERERIFLISSLASLLLVLCTELVRRRKARRVAAERVFAQGEGVLEGSDRGLAGTQ